MLRAQPGTVSHGTLRLQDLIPDFVSELERLNHDIKVMNLTYSEVSEAADWDGEKSEYFETESALWDLESLCEALDVHAPYGHTFGTHEGDGSDFGFWPINGINLIEYTVADHFLSAIINGDDSGLDDDDKAQLEAFYEKESTGCESGHWDTDSEEEASFSQCDICGLYANCVTLYWVEVTK